MRDCFTCIKKNTMLCPNSSKCYSTIDKPHYQAKRKKSLSLFKKLTNRKR